MDLKRLVGKTANVEIGKNNKVKKVSIDIETSDTPFLTYSQFVSMYVFFDDEPNTITLVKGKDYSIE